MLKKQPLFILSILTILFVLSGCTGNQSKNMDTSKKKVELTISAAASLQDALTEVKPQFEKENPTIKVNFNFGGSGSLQQQISQGAPVDLFFSAAEDQFALLKKQGLIVKGEGKDLLRNELVLIVPKGGDNRLKGFDSLGSVKRIAIGTPESVPAGKYAKETLEKLNVWNAVQSKLVYAKDVRQVLTYVETGNVDAGIVYRTDALISSKVKIIADAAENAHAPILYPVGVMKNSSHRNEADLFYDYLQKPKTMKLFEKYGFKGLE